MLQYRESHWEIHGKVAPGNAIPKAHAWPDRNNDLSYRDKLVSLLPASGLGAEIGPLHMPLLDKRHYNVLYVDHLDTAGIKKKYRELSGVVDVDRPMVNNSLADTLINDAPLDYVVASQVFEHVPNQLRWLNEIAKILKDGGLLSLSLPDRRMTADFFRQETAAADIYAAYIEDITIPSVRMVYDSQIMSRSVNFERNGYVNLSPQQIVRAKGAVKPMNLSPNNHLAVVQRARDGEYLDVHCCSFTPVSFLLTYSDLARDGLVPFMCQQFYPTNEPSSDRDNHSFTIILKKVGDGVSPEEIRRSFLMPLGE